MFWVKQLANKEPCLLIVVLYFLFCSINTFCDWSSVDRDKAGNPEELKLDTYHLHFLRNATCIHLFISLSYFVCPAMQICMYILFSVTYQLQGRSLWSDGRIMEIIRSQGQGCKDVFQLLIYFFFVNSSFLCVWQEREGAILCLHSTIVRLKGTFKFLLHLLLCINAYAQVSRWLGFMIVPPSSITLVSALVYMIDSFKHILQVYQSFFHLRIKSMTDAMCELFK